MAARYLFIDMDNKKDLGHFWVDYIRIMPNSGTLATECYPNQFWKEVKWKNVGSHSTCQQQALSTGTLLWKVSQILLDFSRNEKCSLKVLWLLLMIYPDQFDFICLKSATESHLKSSIACLGIVVVWNAFVCDKMGFYSY